MSDKSLLQAIFADLRSDEWIELRVVKDRAARNFFYRSVEDAMTAALSAGDGVHCFYGIAPRKSKGGTKEDVSRVTALWMDVDRDDKAEAFWAAQSLVLPPSFLVDSGYNFHAYWLLTQACSPAEAEKVQKELAAALGADATWDCSRVFRVPGTYNIKHDDKQLCQVVKAREDLRYALTDLQAAARVSVKTRDLVLSGDSKGFKSRSERDWCVVRDLMRLGMSERAIRLIFAEQATGDKTRASTGSGYLDRTLQQAGKGAEEPAAIEEFLIEKDGLYWARGRGGGLHPVSTFTYEPLRLLEGSEDVLLGTMHAQGYEWPDIALPKSAFVRITTLMKHLPMAAWQWVGSDREVRFLLPHLLSKWKELGLPKAQGMSAMGRHGEYWVVPEGVLSAKGVLDNYTTPIVYLPSRQEAPEVAYPIDVDPAEHEELLEAIARLLPSLNWPEAIWPIIGWFMAAPLKPVFESFDVRFPILNLFGTRGSGKSSVLLQVMMPLLGYTSPRSWNCSITQFVLLSLMASTNAIPLSFSEFRASLLTKKAYSDLQRTILLSYDVGVEARGRADQTTRRYPLLAPLVIDGEDMIEDPAIQERAIVVNLAPETITENSEGWLAFTELTEFPLHDFAGPYIQYTLGYDSLKLRALWLKCAREVQLAFHTPLADRTRRNVITCLCGIRLLEEYLAGWEIDLPAIGAEVFAGAVSTVVQTAAGRSYISVDKFVVDVINEVARAHASKPFVYRYDELENILWIHLTTARQWWVEKCRRRGESYLGAPAMKRQLKERNTMLHPGAGQYVMDTKTQNVEGRNHHMYGISLEECLLNNMDIPDKLNLREVTVVFKGGEV